MRKQTFVQLAFPLIAIGCASSQAEQVRDAHMEAADARTAASDKAIQSNEKAETGAIDKTYDTEKKSIAKADQPGAGGDEKLVG
ncbi:MAG TPA: hypothetical protein VHZ95_10070, partial [Polyangiales bacterium]|nr:hypothetical protein [Polyangiales bacterium]